MWLLIAGSVVFYAQSGPEHLLILLASILTNYIWGKTAARAKAYGKQALAAIILLNLAPLVYYKYSHFLHLSRESLVLPLAISFFTFQQIAFQVDVYKGKTRPDSIREYLFFVLFFPQLVAGPIVHYNALISQIKAGSWTIFNRPYFNAGIVLFCIGLFKKIVFADNAASIVNHSFSHISSGLSTYDAWAGIFAYSFQIYFDFSGYADMAVGLALLLGIRLPVNFNSPYKAVSLVDFWRRWHITLSDFLRDHIYIPLGGNRLGLYRQLGNLLGTMIVAGIWHGAGWTFLVWGLFHGLALCGLQLKQRLLPRGLKPEKHISVFLTFIAVTLLWVLFRAESIDSAMGYYRVLFDFQSFFLSGFLSGFDPGNMDVYEMLISNEFLLAACFAVIWCFPNSLEIIDYMDGSPRVSLRHCVAAAACLFVALKSMVASPAQAFVYFNF